MRKLAPLILATLLGVAAGGLGGQLVARPASADSRYATVTRHEELGCETCYACFQPIPVYAGASYRELALVYPTPRGRLVRAWVKLCPPCAAREDPLLAVDVVESWKRVQIRRILESERNGWITPSVARQTTAGYAQARPVGRSPAAVSPDRSAG